MKKQLTAFAFLSFYFSNMAFSQALPYKKPDSIIVSYNKERNRLDVEVLSLPRVVGAYPIRLNLDNGHYLKGDFTLKSSFHINKDKTILNKIFVDLYVKEYNSNKDLFVKKPLVIVKESTHFQYENTISKLPLSSKIDISMDVNKNIKFNFSIIYLK